MRIVPYTPDLFPAVAAFARDIGPLCPLAHRSLVDHYYHAGRDFCTLHLAVERTDAGERPSPSDNGPAAGRAGDGASAADSAPGVRVVGSLGVERVRFEYRGRALHLAFGSNFFVSTPGVGGLLYRRWTRAGDHTIAVGGSRDSQRIFREQGWTYYDGLGLYLLNRSFAAGSATPPLQRAMRWSARQLWRHSAIRTALAIPRTVRDLVTVREEPRISEDLLRFGTTGPSPFALRCAPSIEHLAWRYACDLTHVQYRIYRLQVCGDSAGYIIINDGPSRIVVAHCDGRDPETLAYGVVLAALDTLGATGREVRLTSCHPAMTAIYRRVGFRPHPSPPPLVLGSRRRPGQTGKGAAATPPLPDDTTADWLINYDWGDNGLRRPSWDE
ncbi:MAG: hypothetical protein AAGC55_02105 [Myxococcota bacterium]